MNKIKSEEVPDWYPVCIKSDCPMAEHCLHQLAMRLLTDDYKIVRIVNPLLTQPSEKCEFYRTDELQSYARGFKQMQMDMLPRQYSTFMYRLIGQFGRTGYFERRRGERLCSPKEIKLIEDVLKELGLKNLSFDTYERRYNWDD